MAHQHSIAVLMGPTGSGKSAMAIAVAKTRPTVIINADAMQMVDGLHILTARPTAEEMQQAEHALYGVLPPEEPTSVARWLELVEPVIHRAWEQGKLPLLVGGTGMYVKALKEGIAKIPPIPPAVRERVRAYAPAERFARLQAQDAVMAARLKPGDTQRVLRALEVVEATGQSLDHWQRLGNHRQLPEALFQEYYIDLPRAEIYRRIDARFEAMMQAGALAEVRALLARKIPSDNPILRAHGVPELMRHLRGEMALEAAIAKAQQNTRNYAKRQITWIRNQMASGIGVGQPEDLLAEIES